MYRYEQGEIPVTHLATSHIPKGDNFAEDEQHGKILIFKSQRKAIDQHIHDNIL